MKTNSQGFTLIELLVVIAIIGILATMSVVALNSAREKARDSRRLSDVKNIQTALEMYYSNESQYPTSTNVINISQNSTFQTKVDDFMSDVPANPTPHGDGDCPDNATYQYITDNEGSTYTLMYCTGSAASLDNAGTQCATQASISESYPGSDNVCDNTNYSDALSW